MSKIVFVQCFVKSDQISLYFNCNDGVGVGGIHRMKFEGRPFATMATIDFVGYVDNPESSNKETVRASSQVLLKFE